MKEEYKIEIETTGDYKDRKIFNVTATLSPRQFSALINQIMDFIENPELLKP